jgi:hypothetical protein
MHRARVALAAVGVLGFTGAASAQLAGTELNIFQQFNGTFATTTNGPLIYAGPPVVYPDLSFPGFSWTATSPAPTPPAGFDNSIFCDYALFGLTDFAGTQSTITLSSIDVAVAAGSARLINSLGTEIGTPTSGGDQIQITFNIDDVLIGPTDTMTVAWDNGGVACYPDCDGLGGLTVADFSCFQTKFVQGDPYADCDGLGGLTVADFSCFQTKFVQGCN